MQEKDVGYNKWTQPGWRIEPRYSNKVLIGNWAEEKLQFTRECKTANSTNRLDFRPQLGHRPDVIVRRHALRRAEGLPLRQLLFHHDTPTSHFLVSLYDESYSRQCTSDLPTLRTWHSDKMGWIPERSDHPIQGPPTNYGLLESFQARVQQQQGVLPMLSVYKAAYPLHPTSAFCQPRHARAPRLISGNKKNLELKPEPGNTDSFLPPLQCV
ncbi:cilia- and flagella-associated protein 107 [Salminus brasiliensis]|uniref:cilia- and flagella-associated protein 107 n=1 Tax=Salminus brasiliensis TaxID=930266 RepID=UPI003B838E04